jgi:hypothetical protein
MRRGVSKTGVLPNGVQRCLAQRSEVNTVGETSLSNTKPADGSL